MANVDAAGRKPAKLLASAPKYVSIQRDLTRRITKGEFRVGKPLPSQRELSNQYGVSLMTLRQALQALDEQGLVEQIAGKGTFVRRHRVPYAITGLRSLTDDLRAQGFEVETLLLRVALEKVPDTFPARIGAATEKALAIERLRVVDEQPVVHQLSYVPQPFAAKLRNADLYQRSLYGLLEERCGAAPVRAIETMAPAVIPESMTEVLAVPPGTLALQSDRVTFDAHGVALVYDRALLVGDRIVLTTERLARSHTLSYQLNDISLPGA